MRFRRSFISIFMVFVFGVLSLKVLFSSAMAHGSCDEFGHIHFHKLRTASQNIYITSKSLEHHDDDDENCHEGKSVFTYAPYPTEAFDFVLPNNFDLVFEFVFSIKNNFKTPYLEPYRKPPKYS